MIHLNQIHHIQEIASGLSVFPLCNSLGEIFFFCLEFSFLFDCRLYRVACAPISNEIISQKAETRHNQPLAALYLPLVGVFASATLELGRTQKDVNSKRQRTEREFNTVIWQFCTLAMFYLIADSICFLCLGEHTFLMKSFRRLAADSSRHHQTAFAAVTKSFYDLLCGKM